MAPVPTRTPRLLFAWALALVVCWASGRPPRARTTARTGRCRASKLERPGSELSLDSRAEPFRDAVLRGFGAGRGAPCRERLAHVSHPRWNAAANRGQPPSTRAPGVPEQVAALIGSFVHGAELSRLSVMITTPSGAGSLCSAGQPACYLPFDGQLMVVPGEQPDNAMPLEMMIAHEYGHHVAANRDNDPWTASFWGTKRWATAEGVCGGVAAGTAFPGAGGEQYWSNPGEAFAQAYAFMHYPEEVPWWWRIAEPDAEAYAAIRADVEQPWAPTSGGVSGGCRTATTSSRSRRTLRSTGPTGRRCAGRVTPSTT